MLDAMRPDRMKRRLVLATVLLVAAPTVAVGFGLLRLAEQRERAEIAPSPG